MTESTERSPWIPEREIRFAVVIYGGVSLAIYINGVVQEMLHMVRSTSPAIKTLEGSELVYRKLAHLVGDPHSISQKAVSREPGNAGLSPDANRSSPDNTGLPRSRFIVDILSGTSAGGINAVFLAKALTNGVSLTSLAEMWIRDADIEFLLNDHKTKNPSYLVEDPPRALLNSRWMYTKLLAALQTMSNSDSAGSLVGDLDLFCTTTDLSGLPIKVALTDKSVEELRYKNVYHFKRRGVPEDFGKNEPTHADTDHFTAEMDPFLAFAARCTSSFPLAFEPMLLNDIREILESPQFRSDYVIGGRDSEGCLPKFGEEFGKFKGASKWEDLCQVYPDERTAAKARQVPFADRAFADGGYLDNKPFSYAVDTVMQRHATVPVDRKLIYIEPEPETFSSTSKPARAKESDRPNAIGNILDALITLPRYETIRQDLERLIEWNHSIARLRRVIDEVTMSIRHFAASDLKPNPMQDWRRSPAYRTYLRLRLSSCADQLTSRICLALRYDPQSAEAEAIRAIIGQWRETAFEGDAAESKFLLLFDFAYLGRVIRYLRMNLQAQRADSKYLGELSKATTDFQSTSDRVPRFTVESSADMLESWKQYLNFIVDPIFAASLPERPKLTALELNASDIGRDARVKRLFSASELSREDCQSAVIKIGRVEFRVIVDLIGQQLRSFYSPEPMVPQSSRQPGDSETGHTERRSSTILNRLIRQLSPLFEEMDRLDPKSGFLRTWDFFDMQDSLVFPIMFGTSLGEFETVDIFRISPRDSTTIHGVHNERHDEPQLKGAQFAAFGGFLDQTWRFHDMLRGRLDGAERLITAVLPDADPDTLKVREALIREAQEAIALDWRAFSATLKDPIGVGATGGTKQT